MEHRMKTHGLTPEQMDQLLARAQVGRLVTLDEDGFPYAVPVHFVYSGGKVYVHGLPRGQKLANLARDNRVCFEVDEMLDFIQEGVENPCDVNTDYNSVIIRGHGALVEDVALKTAVLKEVIAKYTPNLAQMPMPEKMVQGTGVIEVTILSQTGKYYR